MGVLRVEPERREFTAGIQAAANFALINAIAQHVAVKVKCSQNELFRVRPVFVLIAPRGRAQLEVVRSPHPPKHAKLVVQALAYPRATATELELSNFFKAPPSTPPTIRVRLICGNEPFSDGTLPSDLPKLAPIPAPLPAPVPAPAGNRVPPASPVPRPIVNPGQYLRAPQSPVRSPGGQATWARPQAFPPPLPPAPLDQAPASPCSVAQANIRAPPPEDPPSGYTNPPAKVADLEASYVQMPANPPAPDTLPYTSDATITNKTNKLTSQSQAKTKQQSLKSKAPTTAKQTSLREKGRASAKTKAGTSSQKNKKSPAGGSKKTKGGESTNTKKKDRKLA